MTENNDKSKVIVQLEKELVKAKDFSEKHKIESIAAEEKHKINVKTIDTKSDEKFPLTPMGVLAPGSAHARPSAQPPIDVSGNFPPRVY